MKEGELFSPYVVDLLVRQGERPESVLLTACCDRTFDDTFEDTFVFLSIDKLSFLTVEYDRPIPKMYNGFITKKEKQSDKRDKRENVPCKKKRYVSYRISEIKELKLVNLIASGVAYVVFEDGRPTEAISAYTNACVGDLSKVAKAVGKIKEDGVLNIAEFKDKEDETRCPKCGRPYIDKVRKVCPKCADRKSTFRRILKMIPKYWKYFAISIIMTYVTAAFQLASPYLSGVLFYDKVLSDQTSWWFGKVWLMVIILFVFSILNLYAFCITRVNMVKLSENLLYDLKCQIFETFQKMSMSFFTKNQIGTLMQRVNADASTINSWFVNSVPWALRSVVHFVVGAVMVATLNPDILWLAIIPVFTVYVVLRSTRKFLRRMYIKSFRAGASLSNIVSDSLRGVKVVKAFGKEGDEITRFDKANQKNFKLSLTMARLSNMLSPLNTFIMNLVTYGLWLISGRVIIIGGVLTYGTFTSTLSYFNMMVSPITSIQGIIEQWQNCMTAGQRMFDLADAEPDVKESKNPIVVDKFKGDIDINNVTFGYEPNQVILDKIDVHIKAGEMIGIVGHSGAGKSTLINLITRMYDVNEGEIKIDGYNVKDIAIRSLRDNIALVTQDTYIFQGTVLDNIAYANPEVSREEVIAAAKIARCHDFIEMMPEGYDTMVGPGYRTMSGGERQRVSIARAILINPRILILDEATAALDTETEMSIQNALDSLTAGRTTLAIAHRLSTLRNADRLVVIDDGKITEVGTHAELVKNKGVYYRLMMKQAEALKTKGIS